MQRKFTQILEKWKKDTTKPLMIVGARQVGKTYIIEEFCKNNFKNYIYINLEKQEEIKNVFEKTIEPEEIMKKISLILNKDFTYDDTIFFFDECQVSERFILSLKYFCESNINYNIICAGSLLGVKINRFTSSFPVGKIHIEYMYPMDFEEYLMALNEHKLLNEIKRCYDGLIPIDNFLHEKALDLYRTYLCIGGMPEAVNNYIENGQNIQKFDKQILSVIIDMYIADMNKYTINYSESVKIENIYKSISRQLAKENKKFQYSNVSKGANKRDYFSSVEWLISSGMVYRCNLVDKIDIPLKAFINENIYKLYLSDVGLLSSISGILFNDLMLDKPFMYKGVIAENYVAQTLISNKIDLCYWNSGNEAEIDFIIYNEDGIIPVEVKASNNNRAKSLQIYMDKYKPKYAYRISTKNFGFENNIKSIPLYATFCIK